MPRLREPGKPRLKKDLDARVERTWRSLPPEFNGAARSTVEAAMVTLTARGVDALRDLACQQRLAQLSIAQIKEVIERLRKLDSDEQLIRKLEAQI